MKRGEYKVNLGILPSIVSDKEFEIVKRFFELLTEHFEKVYYILPHKGLPSRVKGYEEKLLELMENLGIQKIETNERVINHLFIEDDKENSLEAILGDDQRFRDFAKIRLNYLEHAIRDKIKYAESDGDKQKYEKELERIRKIKERLFKETEEQEVLQTEQQKSQVEEEKAIQVEEKDKQPEEVKTNKLYIHLDLANLMPPKQLTWYDLRMWAEFLNSVISITRSRLKHKGDYEVIAYLESYFKPEIYRTSHEKEGLKKFRNERFSEEVNQIFRSDQEFTDTFITFLTNIMGFDVEISPKEAEQLIPDKIKELKEKEPDSLHAIISDDRGRDKTKCDLRVVHYEYRKRKVKAEGASKDVISLEEYKFEPFIQWWFLKSEKSQPEELPKNQEVIKRHRLDLENIKMELENFSFYSGSQKTFVILEMLYHYRKNQEKFRNFWINLEQGLVVNFYENLKEYQDRNLKIQILLALYEIEDDIENKRKIIDLLKESGLIDLLKENGLEEEVVEVLSLETDEEDLEIKLNSLKRRFEDRIKLDKEIQRLKEEIAHIEKIAKDENINEERKKRLEERLKSLKESYENLKRIINDYEKEIDDLNNKVKSLEEEKRNLENIKQKRSGEKENLEKEIEGLKKEISNLDMEIEDKKVDIEKLTKQKEEFDMQLQRLISEEEKLRDAINSLKLSKEEKQKDIQRLQEEKQSLEDEVSKLKPIIEQLQKEIEERKQELADYEKVKQTYDKLIQKDRMEEYIQKRKEELQSLEQSLTELEESIQSLEKEIDEKRQTLEESREKVKRLSENKGKLEKEMETLEKDVEILEQKNMEYGKMLEELKKRKQSLQEYEKIYRDKSSEIRELINKIDSFIKTLL